MVEVVTLLTAVVSATAAAVSAWVAVAQWRESRAARAAGGAGGAAPGDAVVGDGRGGAGTRPGDGPGRPDVGGDVDDPGRPGTGGREPEPGRADQSARPDRPGEPAPVGPRGPAGSRPPTDWVLPRSVDEGDVTDTASRPPAPSRTLAAASGVAAVCLALTAAALVGHALEDQDGTAAEGLAGTLLSVAMLLSVCGAGLATWVIATRRSRTARDQRRAALAFAGSLAPWIALTVLDLVRGLAG
ncbi:hypothetical protein [Cellulomonas cellasea]|uniref:Uncharacterized protein n=1 Tax=Cellulomonas cellasea TaxID=43670 RepID=A0A7W4UDZ8_9CELL|nr:hypothetical protein [Cellulomonas cellasea]MBB2922441.1 hypothetical protein [Cellulomonas cellasea]